MLAGTRGDPTMAFGEVRSIKSQEIEGNETKVAPLIVEF